MWSCVINYKIRFTDLFDIIESNCIYVGCFLAKNIFDLGLSCMPAKSQTDLRKSVWEAKPITPLMVRRVDGETFYVDWNRNNYTESEEKIRLVFVNTLELNQSHKGQDLKFGLPVRYFLKV
jgi:endonuclease YncB( thermonuclease family)